MLNHFVSGIIPKYIEIERYNLFDLNDIKLLENSKLSNEYNKTGAKKCFGLYCYKSVMIVEYIEEKLCYCISIKNTDHWDYEDIIPIIYTETVEDLLNIMIKCSDYTI